MYHAWKEETSRGREKRREEWWTEKSIEWRTKKEYNRERDKRGKNVMKWIIECLKEEERKGRMRSVEACDGVNQMLLCDAMYQDWTERYVVEVREDLIAHLRPIGPWIWGVSDWEPFTPGYRVSATSRLPQFTLPRSVQVLIYHQSQNMKMTWMMTWMTWAPSGQDWNSGQRILSQEELKPLKYR